MANIIISAEIGLAPVNLGDLRNRIQKRLQGLIVSASTEKLAKQIQSVTSKPFAITITPSNLKKLQEQTKKAIESIKASPQVTIGGKTTKLPAPGAGAAGAKNLEAALKRVQLVQRKITEGIRQSIKAEDTLARQALNTAKAFLSTLPAGRQRTELTKKLKEAERDHKKEIQRANKAVQKQIDLQNRNIATVERLRAVGKVPSQAQLGKAGLQATGIEQAVQQANRLKGLRAQLAAVNQQTRITSQGLSQFGGNATAAAAALGGPLARSLGIAGKAGQGFGLQIAFAAVRIAAFAIATRLIFGLQRAFGDAARNVIKFESALASANKIFNVSARELREVGDAQLQLSIDFAQGISTVQKVSVDFARQGLTTNEVLKATEGALLLVNAAGVSTAQAMELLTIVVNAFGKSFEDATEIADIFSSIADVTASSVQDLIKGFARAGSTAEAAGFSVEELAAAIAVVREATRRTPTAIGTALRSIITFTVTSSDKLEELGVSVRNTDGSMRKFSEILIDLKTVFSNLNDVQRINIATSIVGRRRVNEFLAAVKGAEKIQRVAAIGAAAQGTAQKKANIELETGAAKLRKLGATFFAVVQQIAQTGLLGVFKQVADALSFVLGGVSKFIEFLNKIPGLGPGILALTSGFLIFKFIVPFVKEIVIGILKYRNALRGTLDANKQNANVTSTIGLLIQQQIVAEEKKLQTILKQSGALRTQGKIRQTNATTTARTTQKTTQQQVKKIPVAPLANQGQAAFVKIGKAGETAFVRIRQEVKKTAFTLDQLGQRGVKAFSKIAARAKTAFKGIGAQLKDSAGLLGAAAGFALVNLGESLKGTNQDVNKLSGALIGLGKGVEIGAFASLVGFKPSQAVGIGAIVASVLILDELIKSLPSIEDKLKSGEETIIRQVKDLQKIRDLVEKVGDLSKSTASDRLALAGALIRIDNKNLSLAKDILNIQRSGIDATEARLRAEGALISTLSKQNELLEESFGLGAGADFFNVTNAKKEGASLGLKIGAAVGAAIGVAISVFTTAGIAALPAAALGAAIGGAIGSAIGFALSDSQADIFKVIREIDEELQETADADDFIEAQEKKEKALKRFADRARQVALITIAELEVGGKTARVTEVREGIERKLFAVSVKRAAAEGEITDETAQHLINLKQVNEESLANFILSDNISDSARKLLLADLSIIKANAARLAGEEKIKREALKLRELLSDIETISKNLARTKLLEGTLKDIERIKSRLGAETFKIKGISEIQKRVDEIQRTEEDIDRLLNAREQTSARIAAELSKIARKELESKDILALSRKEALKLLDITEQEVRAKDKSKQREIAILNEIEKLRDVGFNILDLQRKQNLEALKRLESAKANLTVAQEQSKLTKQEQELTRFTAKAEFEIFKLKEASANVTDKFGLESVELAKRRQELEIEILKTRNKQAEQKLVFEQKEAKKSAIGTLEELKKIFDIPIVTNIRFGERDEDDVIGRAKKIRNLIFATLDDLEKGGEVNIGKFIERIDALEKAANNALIPLSELDRSAFKRIATEARSAITNIEEFGSVSEDAAQKLKTLREASEIEVKKLEQRGIREIINLQKKINKGFLDTLKQAISEIEAAAVKGIGIEFSLEELRRGGVSTDEDRIAQIRQEAAVREKSAQDARIAAINLFGQKTREATDAEINLAKVRLNNINSVLDAQLNASKAQISAAKTAGATWLGFNREQRVAFIRQIALAQNLFGNVKSLGDAQKVIQKELARGQAGRNNLLQILEAFSVIKGTGREIGEVNTDILSEQIKLQADGRDLIQKQIDETKALDTRRNELLLELIAAIKGPEVIPGDPGTPITALIQEVGQALVKSGISFETAIERARAKFEPLVDQVFAASNEAERITEQRDAKSKEISALEKRGREIEQERLEAIKNQDKAAAQLADREEAANDKKLEKAQEELTALEKARSEANKLTRDLSRALQPLQKLIIALEGTKPEGIAEATKLLSDLGKLPRDLEGIRKEITAILTKIAAKPEPKPLFIPIQLVSLELVSLQPITISAESIKALNNIAQKIEDAGKARAQAVSAQDVSGFRDQIEAAAEVVGESMIEAADDFKGKVEDVGEFLGNVIKDSMASASEETLKNVVDGLGQKLSEKITGSRIDIELNEADRELLQTTREGIKGEFTVKLPPPEARSFTVNVSATELVSSIVAGLQDTVSKEELTNILKSINEALGGLLDRTGISLE